MSATPTESSAKSKGPSLGVIFLTIFIDLVGFSVIFPLFPALLEHYGQDGLLLWLTERLDAFSEATGAGERFTPVLFGGILGSMYATLQFFFAPLWGSLSDRIGRRPVLLLTTAGTLISYLLWVFAGNFGLLIAARLLGGAMSGNLSVATAAVADVTTDANRSKGMGVIGVAFGLGFVIGPAIGGILSIWNPLAANPEWAAYGINPFTGVAIVATILSAINLIWIHARFAESLPAEKRGQSELERNPIKRLLQPQPKNVQRANLAYLFYIFAFSGMEFTLSFLGVERYDFSIKDITWMMIFIGFLLILTQGGLVRRLAPIWGEKRTATLGLTLVAVGLAILGASGSVTQMYGGLAFMAIGAGLCSPTMTALISLYTDEQNQGRALGVFRSIGSLGRALGPILASIAFWWFGSDKLYLAGAALVVIAAALCSKLPQPEKLS